MSKTRSIFEQLCHALGKNNDASYAVVAVATAKGIFRPMFTMMDEHQDIQTRKYTAMREGLTEAIAIPCYLSVAWAAKKVVAPLICKSQAPEQIKKAAKTLSFLGVCSAALVIIPAACSALITPIMDFMGKNPENHKNKKLDIKETPIVLNSEITQPKQPTTKLNTPYSAFITTPHNTGLTIGGNR